MYMTGLGQSIDTASVRIISEDNVRLKFSIPVVEFLGVPKRPHDLAASGLSCGCVLRNALRHVPLSVKQKVNNFPLEATIDHLAKLRAVSIWIELAFLAPDRDGQSRAAGLTPDDIRPRGLRRNRFHRAGKVHALNIGETLLLPEGGKTQSAEENWQGHSVA